MSEEQERDFVAEAKEQGWMDQEAYEKAHGHTKGWSDAETFVKRGEEILPFVNAKAKRLQQEVESLRSELSEVKSATEDWKEFTKAERERLKERNAALEKELRSARAKAVADGDAKAFAEADDALEELREQKAERRNVDADSERASKLQKEVDAWKSENDWYETDYTKTAALNGAANEVVRLKPELQGSGRKLFDAALEKAQEMFPDVFGDKPNGASKVEDGGRRSRRSPRDRSYDNLPPDAKAACDKFVKQGLYKTREDYVEAYEWE